MLLLIGWIASYENQYETEQWTGSLLWFSDMIMTVIILDVATDDDGVLFALQNEIILKFMIIWW